jgi:hypothetical protein
MNHGGNVRLRGMVPDYVAEYMASPRDQKSSVLRKLISKWTSSTTPEGRFLKRANNSGGWWVVPDAEVVAIVQKLVTRKPGVEPELRTTESATPSPSTLRADGGAAAAALVDLSSWADRALVSPTPAFAEPLIHAGAPPRPRTPQALPTTATARGTPTDFGAATHPAFM